MGAASASCAGGRGLEEHFLILTTCGLQSEGFSPRPLTLDQSVRNNGVEHGANKQQPHIVPLHRCPGGWGWGGGRGWCRHQSYYSDRWSEGGRTRWTMKGRWKPLLVSQSASSPERRVSWMMVNLLKQAETTEWARDGLKIELNTGPSFSAHDFQDTPETVTQVLVPGSQSQNVQEMSAAPQRVKTSEQPVSPHVCERSPMVVWIQKLTTDSFTDEVNQILDPKHHWRATIFNLKRLLYYIGTNMCCHHRFIFSICITVESTGCKHCSRVKWL